MFEYQWGGGAMEQKNLNVFNKLEEKTQEQNPVYFTKRIGTTLYQVNVFFDESAVKSVEDKLLHLLSNDLSLGAIGNNDN